MKPKIGRPPVAAFVRTQAEVARELGVSRQMVDRIEKRALAKIRTFLLLQGAA